MEKRVVFQNKALPYLLVAPQILITVVFFFWPASQAIYQSFLIADPFGLGSQFYLNTVPAARVTERSG